MTYKDYFVTEVKVNGKILRVQQDKVFLPFGSEYSLLLKNLNTKRAKVTIQIDGQDVLNGTSLVLNCNESVDLQGFMKNNQVTNRFKFIEKTQEISDYRGDKPEDGLIRVEFAYEKPAVYYMHWPNNYWNPGDLPWALYGNTKISKSSSFGSDSCSRGVTGQALNSICEEVNCYHQSTETVNLSNDAGITVKGSETKQDFVYTTFGECEPSNVIVIQLVGKRDSGNVVQQPITVERKLTCRTCGRDWKSFHKFCGNCGTFLE